MSPTLSPRSTVYRGSLEYVSDYWEAGLPGVAEFVAAAPDKHVDIDIGYVDNGVPRVIRQIADGAIEEWQLDFTPASVTGVMRGRDQAAKLLDTYMAEQYGPNEDSATGLNCGEPSDPLALPPPANLGPAPASQIAAGACAKAGLVLQWGVRDYVVSKPFSAKGRIIDVITELVRPWNLFAPFRVDIVLRGTTLLVRHRYPVPVPPLDLPASDSYPTLPPVPFINPPADWYFTLAQARQSRLTLRRRLLTRIGRVTFTGIQTTTDPTKPPPAPTTVTETDESETFDPTGTPLTRTLTEYVYQMPDRVLLEQTRRTWRIAFGQRFLVHEEFLTNFYADVRYDVGGNPTAVRKLTAQHVSRREHTYTLFLDALGGAVDFVESIEEDTGYDYDACGFLKKQTTVARHLTDVFKSTLTVKNIRTVRPLVVEQVTERSTWNGSAWVVRQRDTQTQAGYPPDGPGRLGAGHGASTTQVPTVVQTGTVSTDPTAQALDYENENLGLADLNHILTMAKAADNLWEFEATFDGATMPWLRTGDRVQLSGIQDDGGTEVPVPTLVITEIETRAEVAEARASLTSRVRAFGYLPVAS